MIDPTNTCTHYSHRKILENLNHRKDPETLDERLDALHPLPSDILTNSGAPRADNYFCGLRGLRLPRVFICSERSPYPPSPTLRFLSTHCSLLTSCNLLASFPRPDAQTRRFFVLKAAALLHFFFFMRARRLYHGHGWKRVRGVVKRSAF